MLETVVGMVAVRAVIALATLSCYATGAFACGIATSNVGFGGSDET
jgi:hypothetical protein